MSWFIEAPAPAVTDSSNVRYIDFGASLPRNVEVGFPRLAGEIDQPSAEQHEEHELQSTTGLTRGQLHRAEIAFASGLDLAPLLDCDIDTSWIDYGDAQGSTAPDFSAALAPVA